MCNPVTFHGVTPAVWACLKEKLIDSGATWRSPLGVTNTPIPQIAGSIDGHGVAASFTWDGADALTVTVTGKPFFISCGHITGAIHDALVACGARS